jgi:NADH:ubiquinone oxidoreductase subunit 6 (subunit J)
MMLLAAVDWHALFFYLFAATACLFAAGVVFSSNVVHMAFYLTLSLGATSALFFLAGAEFVGAMQLLIYVGGTLVLLIFGVMLTAQRRFISMKTRAGEWIGAAILGGTFLVVLISVCWSMPEWSQSSPPRDVSLADSKLTSEIGLALSGIRLDGNSGYMLPFIIVSMHLLVVLIGAGYLARAKRRVDSEVS